MLTYIPMVIKNGWLMAEGVEFAEQGATVWIIPQGTPDKNFQAGFGELEMIFITLRRI